MAALRRGAGDDAVCAMIEYGIHGDHHGHPDKLNLVLYALGQEQVLDPGRISYSVPEYETWCRTTVAHNTIVINERNQEPATGESWYFEATNTYTACLCATDKAYPGHLLKRFLVLTDNLLVDAFAVEGGRTATLDWMLHCRGSVTSDLAFTPADAPGQDNGYQHLRAVQTTRGTDSACLSFEQTPGKPLHVIVTGDAESTIYRGIGIGYHLGDAVPFLMRRRTGKATVFLTVTDLSGASRNEVKVERVPVKAGDKELREWEGVGLKIVRGASAIIVGLDLRKDSEGTTTVAGAPFVRILVHAIPAPP